MNRNVIALVMLLPVCTLASRAQQTETSKVSEAQQADALLSNEELSDLDAFFSYEDSLSIFTMIDSLFTMSELESKSQLAIRLGYNSNAASNNRSLGISQFGLSPGISFYHKSGAYMDASGYWSTEYDPKYYLTILSAGYIGIISPKWSFLGEYSRYLYSDLGEDITISYNNSIGVSNFIDLKPLTFRLDYTLLFGEKVGHRILPGVMLNFEKRNWRNINRILFYPSFNLLLGSEKLEEYLPYSNTLAGALIRVRNGLPLYYTNEETLFGIMNYSFTTPISMTFKNWNFLISYTYNIPKALPGEELGLTNSGYISASITRYFRLK